MFRLFGKQFFEGLFLFICGRADFIVLKKMSWRCESLGNSFSRFSWAISKAFVKPTIPGTFKVPLLSPCSWVPPKVIGSRVVPLFI